MGIATFCVLTVSLLLVGFTSLFFMNIEIMLGSIESKNELELFLKESYSESEIAAFTEQVNNVQNVSSVKYYPKEKALNDYIDQMQGYEDVFSELKNDNPLPDAFQIKVDDTSKMTETVNTLSAMEFTESVKAPTDFAKILNKLKKVVSIMSIALLTVLIIVSLIMISNSTRASVYSRRREINIMKYVGATDTFIRVPFFFEGLFTGFVSGIGASVATYFGYTALEDAIKDISFWELIGISEPLPFENVKIAVFAVYLCIGAFIGAIGSVISTNKHLKV